MADSPAIDVGPRHKSARIIFFVVLAVAIVATFTGEKMGLLTNVATDEHVVAASPEKTLAAVRTTAAAMPRWTSVKDDGRLLEWEARTKLIGFVDDVRIELSPEGTGTRLRLRSASRVGLSDWGTNGRRLRSFLAALDKELASSK
jgi:uncharacterized protein (DUF1499 family)